MEQPLEGPYIPQPLTHHPSFTQDEADGIRNLYYSLGGGYQSITIAKMPPPRQIIGPYTGDPTDIFVVKHVIMRPKRAITRRPKSTLAREWAVLQDEYGRYVCTAYEVINTHIYYDPPPDKKGGLL